MKSLLLGVWLILSCFSSGLALQKDTSPAPLLLVKIDGAITPVTADFLLGSLEEAQKGPYQAVIWELDTPGGLVESTHRIVKAVLASRVPVIVYVAPAGARAASAGTFLVLSAHVAAMAPGTHLGAAHPLTLFGEKMDRKTRQKIENDLVAWARSLAKLRKRNPKFAEEAVTQSRTLTSEEALKAGVIDLIAEDLDQLLRKIDGRRVSWDHQTVVLHTKGASLSLYREGLKTRILRYLVHPQIAYLLFLLGLAGIYFELSHPGAVLPGVVGAIALVLALYALHILPVNYAGLLLILLAAVLYFLEIKIASHGLLALTASLCLFLGSLMLFGKSPPAFHLPYSFLLPVVSVIALFFLTLTYLAARALYRRPISGPEGLLGQEGRSLSEIGPEGGQVFVAGEIWQAFSETPIPPQTPVQVISQKGLKLKVKALKETRD